MGLFKNLIKKEVKKSVTAAAVEKNKKASVKQEKKQHKQSEQKINLSIVADDLNAGKTVVFYSYGQVIKIVPEPPGSYGDYRELINTANIIVSDGIRYDLTNPKDISNIATPVFRLDHPDKNARNLGVTGFLDYVLRLYADTQFKEKNIDIGVASLRKATQLMEKSTIGWQKKDFYRIVSRLDKVGYFEEAEEWEKRINAMFPTEYIFNNGNDACKTAEELGTDLVYTSWAEGQSAATAKYQGRIYSISGKDKRFPILPDFMKTPNDVCAPSGPFVYYDGATIYYKGNEEPAQAISWRPFIDDRTEEDKERYAKLLSNKAREINGTIETRIYYRIKQTLPDMAPKSQNAFYRMKEQNAEEYQELIEKTKVMGVSIPTLKIITEPEDPSPSYTGGRN